MTKIIVDLQQNYGGDVLLATDAFKQFFPPIDPFGGSRLRSFKYSDALGTTFTQYYSDNSLNQSYAETFLDIPWAVLDYIENNNQNFTSWPEFFGPHRDHGDFFSTVQRNNISSELFDEVATGGYNGAGIVVYGYGNRSVSTPPPFASEDIIILTDSICHSACALFAEMMQHQGGVRTVVIGGRPSIGPMQAIAGTRGAFLYNADDLDNDIAFVIQVNSSVSDQLPASHVNDDRLFSINSATFNLRDQIREGADEYFPQQFAYEAAYCRIYWTMSTFNNFTNLWKYAANAVWNDSSLCVKDSMNYPSPSQTDTVGPSESQKVSWAAASFNSSPFGSISGGVVNPGYIGSNDGIADDSIIPNNALDKHCDPSRRNSCPGRGQTCTGIEFCMQGVYKTDTQCKQVCTSSQSCGVDSKGVRTFCNIYDSKCTKGTNGQIVCNYLADSRIGSGGRKSTTGANNTRAYAYTGFCEPRINYQQQGSCQNSVDDDDLPPSGPLPASPSLAALADQPNGIIFDDPTSLDEQENADTPYLDDSV